MSTLMILSLLAHAGAFVLIVALYRLSNERKAQRDQAREVASESLKQANELVKIMAETARVNGVEMNELLIEAKTTVEAVSDIWNVPLPYGRWGDFPNEDGGPTPQIRGFWLDCLSRIIGVKMPKGSKYEWHLHPWPETLIGVSGEVTVMVDDEQKVLRANTIIYIPANVKHCVLKAPVDSTFVCIWGQTEN